MLWLGLLSIVQVAFLPGYLAVCAAKLTEGLCRTLVLSFALSLVMNHFLVLGLVLLGCYRPGVVYALFGAELAALAWTARRWPTLTLVEVWQNVCVYGDCPDFRGEAGENGTVPSVRSVSCSPRRPAC